jgi:hypothetical protein
MMCIAVNHFSLSLSGLGLCAAAITGLFGWCAGLVITRHPLLARLRAAVREISGILSRRQFLPLTGLRDDAEINAVTRHAYQ